jgi:peptide/nickel transport system permease protein
MSRFVMKRLLMIVPVVIAVSFLTLMLVELIPGDPAFAVLGDNPTQEQIDAFHEQVGLDDPIYERYVNWAGNALTGDLNRSVTTGQPVSDIITERVPVTIELAILSQLIAVMISVPLGLYMGFKANSRVDRLLNVGLGALIGVPSFVLALVLSYLLSVRFRLFPVTGWTKLTEDPVGNLKTVFLPALTIALIEVGQWTRLIRADTISTLQENFILAARAKGLTSFTIMRRHALKPSMLPVLTIMGISFARVFSGAVIVEYMFSLPGLGSATIDAVTSKDFVVVQGVVLVISVTYVLVNAFVDVAYNVIDPRTRAVARV